MEAIAVKVVRLVFGLVEVFITWPGVLLEACWPFQGFRYFRTCAATFAAVLWLIALLNLIVIAINGGMP